MINDQLGIAAIAMLCAGYVLVMFVLVPIAVNTVRRYRGEYCCPLCGGELARASNALFLTDPPQVWMKCSGCDYHGHRPLARKGTA